jgi:hypothetical protein
LILPAALHRPLFLFLIESFCLTLAEAEDFLHEV